MTSKFIICLILIFSVFHSSCAQGRREQINNDSTGISIQTTDSLPATPKKVSILGDSYSTFAGYIPENFIAWYMPQPKEGRPTDVTKVEQTWWDIFLKKNGYQLETNNSYSGSTICNTGYEKQDYSDRSFITRVGQLGNPDLILVYGGTNDSWANSPIGEFVYSDWTKNQLKTFRPATAYLLSELQRIYPNAEIVFLVNDENILKPQIISSIREICDHYGVKYVMMNDIEKMSGHPDQKGMLQIAEQLENSLIK